MFRKVLVLYGTTNGHTRKIAHVMADEFAEHGILVDIMNAADARVISANAYEAVIVAASLYRGRYQAPVTRWIKREANALAHLPSMFVSVCLSILEHDPAKRHEAEIVPQAWLDKHGWQPGEMHVVGGALSYTKYGWLKKWLMKKMALKMGGNTDTSADWEYTDWDAVRGYVATFARQHGLVEAEASVV